MQGKNSTKSNAPKDGDGTQQVKKDQDANWYGQSQEPQEEFIADKSSSVDADSKSNSKSQTSGTSEGRPTFSASRKPGAPERADVSDAKEPSDIVNRH